MKRLLFVIGLCVLVLSAYGQVEKGIVFGKMLWIASHS